MAVPKNNKLQLIIYPPNSDITKKKWEFIIIVNNAFSLRWFKYLIKSLNVQECIESSILIIIDYGNELKDLINIIKQNRLAAVIVSLKGKDIGSANQRNLGAFLKKYINSKYTIFMDSDIILLDRKLLCKLILVAEKFNVPAFTHVLFNTDGSVQWSSANLVGPLLFEFKTLRIRETDFLHGAFFALRNDLIDKVISERKYLFTPFYFIGFDDYTLSLMLQRVLHSKSQAKFPSFYFGKIVHIGGATTPRISEKRLREAMKNLFLCFMLTSRKNLLIGIIPEYLVFSVLRSMKNGDLNVFIILKNLLRGLVYGILYWHNVRQHSKRI
jgi:hypothetical protein